MTTELKTISASNRELIITASKDEYLQVFNETLKRIQRNVKMPGFRPGKVPSNIILGQYGDQIKYEAYDEIANRNFREYAEKNAVKSIGQPAFTNVTENEDGSHSFTISFEVLPEFELKDYKTLEVYEPYHKVTDKEVDDELNYQAKRLGKREDIDWANDFDVIVTIDSYDLNVETMESGTEPIHTDMALDLSTPGINEQFKNLFLNCKVGDTIDNIPTDGAGAAERIVVKKLERVVPAELNDEFAKLASGEKFDNIEDFKQEIGFAIQKEWDSRSRQQVEEQLLSKVVEMHDTFELPEQLVINTIAALKENYKKQYPGTDFDSPETIAFIDNTARRMVRTELIENRIIEKEELKLEDYDYDNFLDDFYANNPGIGEMDIQREVLITQLKSDDNTQHRLLHKKYVDLLLDFTKTNEIDFEEYTKMRLSESDASSDTPAE
ncbi:MAG: trigger factor [Ignavibacteria bacterium]|jgi:trigger factor|nr:trigger factor [Ignavibacteria bacterium]